MPNCSLAMGHDDGHAPAPEPCRTQGTPWMTCRDPQGRPIPQGRCRTDLRTQSIQVPADGLAGGGDADKERDPLFDQAARIIIVGPWPVSLVQTTSSATAALPTGRSDGHGRHPGEHKGSVAREVLISIDDWDKMEALESGEEGETNELEVVYDDPDGLDGPVPMRTTAIRQASRAHS